MNKQEFMAQLSELLSDITETEREEALNYYEDYFNDAGVENEAAVIEALGTPQKVAAMIKAGLNDNNGSDGEFSETGYSGYTEEKDEVATRPLPRSFFEKIKNLSGATLILLIILCVFALPILGPVAIALGSLLLSFICTVAVLLFSVVISGVAIFIAGIALIVAGGITMIEVPVVGVLLAGIGLILLGVGVLIGMLGTWLLTKVVPPLLKGLVDLCRKPFERKRGE